MTHDDDGAAAHLCDVDVVARWGMKKLFMCGLSLAIAATMTTVACRQAPVADIKVLSHFTSTNNDRIFVAAYNPDVALESLRFFGKRSTNTSGRNTTVYFYRAGQPLPTAVRQATTLAQASDAILDVSRFSYVFSRSLNGLEHFAACSEDPTPDLCSYAID